MEVCSRRGFALSMRDDNRHKFMPIDRITIFCFAASYAVAWGLELIQVARPRHALVVISTLFGAAGLIAHTLYLIAQRIPLASQSGTLLYLSWILAVFYLCGSIHHRRLAWGVFVLPVILGLIGLAELHGSSAESSQTAEVEPMWRVAHVAFFVFAAVGVCVAFVASLMYLVQAARLKAKTLPGQGLRLLSLERLESMNRAGINLAFPLLTIGVVIGLALLVQERGLLQGWTDPRIVSSFLLWIVFTIVLYLRYGYHLRGKRFAFLTIVAFVLLLCTLVTSHHIGVGGEP
jgi:ABC-type transport system involved in cytochrome c biogenesis permease subunit